MNQYSHLDFFLASIVCSLSALLLLHLHTSAFSHVPALSEIILHNKYIVMRVVQDDNIA